MATKRGKLAGSALVTALLGLFVVRGPTSGPSIAPEANQFIPASLVAEQRIAERNGTKSKSDSESNPLTADSKIPDGPWIASREHFVDPAALRGRPCASELPMFPVGFLDLVETPASDRRRLWCIPDGVNVQAMIAMAPDPVATHLALVFDRTIDAIQLAAASMDYVFDYYWLPWDIDRKTDWASYDSLKQAREEQKQKETQPGLLMFRWDGKAGAANPEVLYVFIVGETPTAGINGEQFKNAVEYVHELRAHNPGPNKDERIHVLGPVTSGSLDSLCRLASSLCQPHAGDKQPRQSEPQDLFTIYSGTVSVKVNDFQIKESGSQNPFQSFVRPFSYAFSDTAKMLQEDHDIQLCNDRHDPEVAILVEGGTTLEDKLVREVQSSNVALCYDWFIYPRYIASLRNAYKAATGQSPASSGNSPASRPALSPNLTDPANSSDEPPDFAKDQSPISQEAILMNFASEMQRKRYKYIGIVSTSELDNAFLVKFLRNTVPDARLFLMDSDVLLQHEPDNAPYIGAFAVTTYPVLNPELTAFGQGIQISPWIDKHRRWPFSDEFEESDFDAAICLIRDMLKNHELGHLVERQDCPSAQKAQDPLLWLTVFGVGGHWPVEVLEPAEDPPAPDSGRSAKSEKASGSGSVSNSTSAPINELKGLPLSWQALCALLCVLAGCHISILLGAWPFSPKFRDFILGTVAPFRRLCAIQTASATLASALLLTGLSAWKAACWGIPAGLMLGAFALPFLLLTVWLVWISISRPILRVPRVPSEIAILCLILSLIFWMILKVIAFCKSGAIGLLVESPVDWWTMATGFTVGALLATCLLLTWEYRNLDSIIEPRSRIPLRWRIAAFSLPWGLALIPVIMWCHLIGDRSGHYGAFFSYRAVHLASAVSPLAPLILLLAAIYLAAVFYVWRLRFEDSVRPKLYSDRYRQEKKMKEEEKNDDWDKFDRDKLRPGLLSELFIARAINGDLKSLFYGLLIFVTWWWLFHPFRFELFERPCFGKLYLALFRLVILLILVSAFRLNRIWDGLRRFLLELNRREAKYVFSRLKGEEWSSIWFYGAEDADWDFMHRSQELVQQLKEYKYTQSLESLDAVAGADRKVAEFERERRNIQKELRKWTLGRLVFDKELKKSFHEQESKFGAAQNSLAELLVRILDDLTKDWKGKLPPIREDIKAAPKLRLREEFAALRWENFIRAVIARIRLLIIFLAVAFSLALFSLGVYAFEPHQALIWSVTALFVVIGSLTVKVMMQMHRDPIIRRITGAESREFLGLEFYARIAALGITPLLTLLATHFPGIAHYVVSYLQPGLDALK